MERASRRKYHYIYKTICIITNKFYIGMHSTNNMEDGYVGSGKRLWHSINKYGKENHIREILEFLPNRTSLKAREKEMINEELLNEELCMNIQLGGGGGLHKMTDGEAKIWHSMGGKKTWELHREEISKMVSEKNKKNWKDGIYDMMYGNKFWLGKRHKPETIEKMKGHSRQNGSNNSQYGKCWITNGTESKKIYKEDVIPDGWTLGRKINKKTK